MGGWNRNSKDAVYLRQLFTTGEVAGHNSPKFIYEKYQNVFGKYGLDSFRGAFNRMKKEMGVDLRDISRAGGENKGKTMVCVYTVVLTSLLIFLLHFFLLLQRIWPQVKKRKRILPRIKS